MGGSRVGKTHGIQRIEEPWKSFSREINLICSTVQQLKHGACTVKLADIVPHWALGLSARSGLREFVLRTCHFREDVYCRFGAGDVYNLVQTEKEFDGIVKGR